MKSHSIFLGTKKRSDRTAHDRGFGPCCCVEQRQEMTQKTINTILTMLRDKLESRETITDDERRVFIITINKVIEQWTSTPNR